MQSLVIVVVVSGERGDSGIKFKDNLQTYLMTRAMLLPLYPTTVVTRWATH
jgi:hypothetical protein